MIKNYEEARNFLDKNGIDLNGIKELATDYTFYWEEGLEDYEIEVYDGGAISEDGKIVVLFPTFDEITGNPTLFAEYLAANGACRGDEYEIERSKHKKDYVTPYEVFFTCVCGYWNPTGFKIVQDLTKTNN